MEIKFRQLPVLKFTFACILFCCYAFESGTSATVQNSDSTKSSSSDSVKATRAIISFLQWYKVNLHNANAFPLLEKGSQGYYRVDEKACTAYLNFLKSSRRIASSYIGHWQTYFKDKAALLIAEKIQSDIPEGFDMDFVLITQEPEIILNKINKLRYNIVSLNKNVALIGVKLPQDNTIAYEFEMYNSKEGWQIGYISTPNYD